MAWRAAACTLPSCLPLKGDADQLEPHSLLLRPNEGRTGREWLSGGQEAAAEARHGRGRFPCLLKALALGEKQTARPVSSLPGLPCFLFPKRILALIGQGREAGAAATTTL